MLILMSVSAGAADCRVLFVGGSIFSTPLKNLFDSPLERPTMVCLSCDNA